MQMRPLYQAIFGVLLITAVVVALENPVVLNEPPARVVPHSARDDNAKSDIKEIKQVVVDSHQRRGPYEERYRLSSTVPAMSSGKDLRRVSLCTFGNLFFIAKSVRSVAGFKNPVRCNRWGPSALILGVNAHRRRNSLSCSSNRPNR